MPGTTRFEPPGTGTVRGFEAWSANRVQSLPWAVLDGARLGIDAGFYIERLLKSQRTQEPLLPALGGIPFGLKGAIEDDILTFRNFSVIPLFVFSGLKPIRQGKTLGQEELAEKRSQAWSLYDKGEAVSAVETFRQAISLEPSSLYKYVMRILRDFNIDYQVAPYSAWAQLLYLKDTPTPVIDAVYGPTELLFGDIDKLIFSWDRHGFRFVIGSQLKAGAKGLTQEQFIDACLLAGSELTDPLPAMDTNPVYAFTNAIELMKSYQSIDNVVKNIGPKTPVAVKNEYLDNHYRAVMSIKHHVIMKDQGEVEPISWWTAPGDVNEFMGERLPEEVYFYLSRGVISAEVLDQLVTKKITEDAPLDNSDDEDYKRVVELLTPIRWQILSLLSQPLNRWWPVQPIELTYWHNKSKPVSFKPSDIQPPAPHELVKEWNVKESVFGQKLKETTKVPSLTFALTSLADTEFAGKTHDTRDEDNLLETTDEIIMNTFWRTLQIREYTDSRHRLTAWGKVLQAALASLKPEDDLEEACFLGIELLRVRAFKPDPEHNAALVSQVASLAKLRHAAIGYTGPLSRELLQFNSIIRPYARTHRHLMEMVLLSMLLNRDATRENRSDWETLGLSIPFWEEINAGLGIAMKTYLDELDNYPEPTDLTTRYTAHTDNLPRMLSQTIDVTANLVRAFKLWDAVIIGIKAVSRDNHIDDAAKFLEVNEWLKDRRPVVAG